MLELVFLVLVLVFLDLLELLLPLPVLMLLLVPVDILLGCFCLGREWCWYGIVPFGNAKL